MQRATPLWPPLPKPFGLQSCKVNYSQIPALNSSRSRVVNVLPKLEESESSLILPAKEKKEQRHHMQRLTLALFVMSFSRKGERLLSEPHRDHAAT